jgi:hypothetical protein
MLILNCFSPHFSLNRSMWVTTGVTEQTNGIANIRGVASIPSRLSGFRVAMARDRHRKPGPFSRDQALLDLDRRTRAGRVMRSVITELTEHIGDATAPQRLLIQSAALKSVRLALLSEQLLDGSPPSEGSDHHALSWLNSLRLDLMALGLERRGAKALDLSEYMRAQATEATDPAKAA